MFVEPQVAAKILEVIKVPQIDDFLMPRDATTFPRIQTVLKTMEVPINEATTHAELPQTLYIDKVIVDMRVVLRRQVPRIQTANTPSIFLVTKHALFPQIQYIDKVIVDMRVARQRQVPRAQTANKPSINQVTKLTVFPQIQYIDKVFVDMRVVMQRQVPHIQTSWKTVGVPPAWFVGKVVEAPVIIQMRRLSLRQCRRFWKSQSFFSFRSNLLRRHSSFHTNAFQSSLSRWMMSTPLPRRCSGSGRKKKKKKGVVDAPAEVFHDEDF